MSELTPNFEIAADFVDALFGTKDAQVTLQSWDDNKKRGQGGSYRTGALTQIWHWVEEEQAKGHAVGVSVYELDGKGRGAEHVVRPIAVVADFDHDPIPEGLVPHLLSCTSPGKSHAIWRVRDMTNEQAIAIMGWFKLTLGSDPQFNVKTSVVRLPGTLHLKNHAAPHLVTFKLGAPSDIRWADDEIRAKVLPFKRQHTIHQAHKNSRVQIVQTESGPRVATNGVHDGNGRHRLNIAAALALGDYATSPQEVAEGLLAYNDTHTPPKPKEEVVRLANWSLERRGSPLGYKVTTPENTAKNTISDPKNKPSTLEVARRIAYATPLLVDVAGNLYWYRAAHWDGINDGMLKRMALDADDEEHTNPNRRSHIVADLRALAQVDFSIEWNDLPATAIPFSDCILDLATDQTMEHAPGLFLDRVLPWSRPNGDAECPMWLKMLHDWWGADSEFETKVKSLQEFFGYVLLSRAPYKKCLVLFGGRDTGKSKVIDALEMMVGIKYTCGIRIQDMGDARKVAPIVGKALNIIPEIDSNAVVSEAGFKAMVSTGDVIQVDAKYRAAFNYRPTAKHVFATNNLPDVRDPTDATYSRWLLLKFNKAIEDNVRIPDHELKAAMLAEMPGILAWAVEGARRLIAKKGAFSQVQESAEVIASKRADCPVQRFVREHYHFAGYDPTNATLKHNRVKLSELYKHFREEVPGVAIRPQEFGKLLTPLNLERRESSGTTWLLGLLPRSDFMASGVWRATAEN